MKTVTKDLDYDSVMALPDVDRVKPKKPNMLFRTLLYVLSKGELKKVRFKSNGKLPDDESILVLMNHSAFIDLEIASYLLYPRPVSIVCTSDGFVGKNFLMRNLGCIPTRKFITDVSLVKDIFYAVRSLKSTVLMYPEASYSFDGTATALPEGLGKLVKKLSVPVVMLRTYGAFQRDPLYNGLRIRDVDVSCDIRNILSTEDCRTMSVDEINRILKDEFTFDNFQWQIDNNVLVSEPFRAVGLNRVLYKCPCCKTESRMDSRDDTVFCKKCGKTYTLTETGSLKALEGETEFDTVPKWYAWERSEVRKQIESGDYLLDIPVKVSILRGNRTKCIYNVGSARLVHDRNGFTLKGCEAGNSKLDLHVPVSSSYSLYSDYFWYEIGDVICIGDRDNLYYCFPQDCGDVVARTRLAAEELFKLEKEAR